MRMVHNSHVDPSRVYAIAVELEEAMTTVSCRDEVLAGSLADVYAASVDGTPTLADLVAGEAANLVLPAAPTFQQSQLVRRALERVRQLIKAFALKHSLTPTACFPQLAPFAWADRFMKSVTLAHVSASSLQTIVGDLWSLVHAGSAAPALE